MQTDPEQLAAHRQAWYDIPWLVAGTASDAQRRRVESHMALCADCRAEMAFQQQVRAALHAGAIPPHDPGPAWRRFEARLAVASASTEAPDPGTTARPEERNTGRRRASGWTRLWAGVAVLQTACLLLLGIGLIARDDGAYRTYSSPPPGASPATIRLVVRPEVSALGLRQLLARHQLRATEISGDALSLGVAPQGLPGSAAPSLQPGAEGAAPGLSAEQRLHRLRAEPGVLLAEPIGGER